MELKPRGEKVGQRHLTPENLENLKTSLKDQLEVIHTSVHPKLNGNLSWNNTTALQSKADPSLSSSSRKLV